jgi:hypothetical protein
MSHHDVRPYPEECQWAREMLGAREDGPLAPGEEVRLSDHLQDCEDCQAVASWIPGIDALAQQLPSPQAPDGAHFARVRDAVMAEVHTTRPDAVTRSAGRPPWRRGWVLAPTALVVVLAGVFALRQGPPTSQLETSRPAVEKDEASKALADASPTRPMEKAERSDIPASQPSAEADEDRSVLAEGKTSSEGLPSPSIPAEEPVEGAQRPLAPETASPLETASEGTEELTTVAAAFAQAVARQNTPGETLALIRLLDLLEQEGQRGSPNEREAPTAGSASQARPRAQMLSQMRREPMEVQPTLTDSIAVFLAKQRTAVDEALRARIEAWLRSR